LQRQRVIVSSDNRNKVIFRQRTQFNPDGQRRLQFGQQIPNGLAMWKAPEAIRQDMVKFFPEP